MNTTSANPREHPVETALTFVNESGFSTSAILTEPRQRTNLAVILCHGFLSDQNSRTNRRLTELLVSQGIATCRFDWYGMGENQRHFSCLTLKQCQEQLDAAFRTLSDRGMTRLGLVGSSFGGLLAILTAPKQPHLHALGLKCPVVDFPEVLRLEFGPEAMARWQSTHHIPNIIGDGAPIPLHYTFYEELLTYDVYETLSDIQAPTLVVHGEQDDLIPRVQIDRLIEKLNSSSRLQLIHDADHQFGRPEDFRIMTNSLSQWMVEHLL